MSIPAISGPSLVGAVQPDRSTVPPPNPAVTTPPGAGLAPPPVEPSVIKSGAPEPLTPQILAALLGQQLALHGSFSGV